MNKIEYEVHQVVDYLNKLLDQDHFLSNIYIKGEVSNVKLHSSNHLYFTLKDNNSRLNCVMFSRFLSEEIAKIKEGDKVVVLGKVTIYKPNGSITFYCKEMRLDGIGNLYFEYERLKQKLESEGLFAKERKKPIPKYPRKIGVVTASTGAAIRDILNVLKRRWPIAKVYIIPSLVQGKEAITDLEYKLQLADKVGFDVIIVGRGGGSIEDLWAFNSENVVRTIANLNTPIVSGIGHETDFTLSDFVVDLRAPTPSAAAEIITPNIEEVSKRLEQIKFDYFRAFKNYLKQKNIALNSYKTNKYFSVPLSILDLPKMRYDLLYSRFFNSYEAYFKNTENKLKNYFDFIVNKTNNILIYRKQEFEKHISLLNALSPLNILKRGYSITLDENDQIIKDIDSINKDDLIKTKLNKGSITSKIIEVNKDEQ